VLLFSWIEEVSAMKRNIAALVFIFICTSIAWMILGGATTARTHGQDTKLKAAVGQLWGTVQSQYAPYIYYQTTKQTQIKRVSGSETIEETKIETFDHPVTLEASDIDIDFHLEHRKKGLLWYSVYNIAFHGVYTIANHTGQTRRFYFEYAFPTVDGIYDDFSIVVDKKKIREFKPISGRIVEFVDIEPDQIKDVEVAYQSQGMDEWWYIFGSGVSHIRNFQLTMDTDFDRIDFSENSVSPTQKVKKDKGWQLRWQYDDLISGIQISLNMPQKVNPGPFVSRVTFFAPISLFLFFFLLLIITAIKDIRVHPMNFFFVAAAYFSFHLLLAYLADHVDIHIALLIASAVSIFLVISYMRIVANAKFAFLEIGISQFVYLVLFSYTFFLTGYTGLAITILCILTLFIVMQLTAKINWEEQFSKKK
jgi:inner membrane protein involved in colicin E2 resistance